MEVVIPVRKGGLGNQLFQVAAGLAVHFETGKHIVLPQALPHIHSTAKYEESVFQGIPNRIPHPIDDQAVERLQQQGFLVYPGSPGFEPWSPVCPPGNLILHGYFQYYPALEPYKEKVASLFLEGLKEWRQPGNSTWIGIHVRRGDYLKFPDVYPILDQSYYLRAILEVEARVPGERHYKIFSDDISWCKEHEMFQNLESVEFVEDQDELRCLGKMIACEGGFVCANSTYSWWAAFLGAYQKGAPCVLPETWIHGASVHLAPKDWIQIPSATGTLLLFPSERLQLKEKKGETYLVRPLRKTVEFYIDKLPESSSSNIQLIFQNEPIAICDKLGVPNLEQYLCANGSRFSSILTYNHKILKACPNAIPFLMPACSWILPSDFRTIDTGKKRFQISSITGSKIMTEGHAFRICLYLNQQLVKGLLAVPVTFFRSSCGPPMPEIGTNPFIHENKMPLFETFQYSFVIENSSQPNYFTEKLIDCLITKTIPIYYGCPNIEEFFDTSGWIRLKAIDPEERLRELIAAWKSEQRTEASYAAYASSIESNYKKCLQHHSQFYSRLNRVLLTLDAFQKT